MGKVRRCKRCGKETWIVAEIVSVIPQLCPPCFEHIAGCEDVSKLVAATRDFRSVRRAESDNVTLNVSWPELQNKFPPLFGFQIQEPGRNRKQDERPDKDKFFKGSSQVHL